MPRFYITRSADINSEPDAERYLARVVHELDPAPRDSGLLDAYGESLFAIDKLDPIGFVRWPKVQS